MAFGPAAGLAIVEPLLEETSLRSYQHLYAVYGDLLDKLGRWKDAIAAFERAAELTKNARERDVCLARAAASRQKALN
jgi:predicted RNA polymerase sigma factor